MTQGLTSLPEAMVREGNVYSIVTAVLPPLFDDW